MKYLFFFLSILVQGQTITYNKSIDIGQADNATSILPTADNSFLLFGGYLDTLSYWQGMHISKIDSLGNLIWNRKYIDTTFYFYPGLGGNCTVTSDGNYIFGSGASFDGNAEFMVGKFNEEGDVLWQTAHGTPEIEQGLSSCEAIDGGYFICGNTRGFNQGSLDGYIVKVDSLGNFLWEQNYGGDLLDGLSFINATSDNGLLFGLASDSYGINGGRASVIIKTDSLGEIEWQEVLYPETNSGAVYISPLSDGSYILRGQKGVPVDTSSYQLPNYIAKVDSNFQEVWIHHFSSYRQKTVSVFRVLENGNIIVCGIHFNQPPYYNSSYGWLALLSGDGELLWENEDYYFHPERDHLLLDVRPTEDGGFIGTGSTYNPEAWHEYSNIWVIKTDSLGQIYEDTTEIDSIDTALPVVSAPKLQISPNPFKDFVEIVSLQPLKDFRLYDMWGRMVLELPNPEKRIVLPFLPSGIYLYLAKDVEGELFSGRVVRE